MNRFRRPIWEQFDLYYFRRLPPFRWWKRWLSVACAIAALAWAGQQIMGSRRIYSSGPMSVGHELIADNCTKCHAPESKFDRLHSLSGTPSSLSFNEACLRCHSVSIGTVKSSGGTAVAAHFSSEEHAQSHDEEITACSACHLEHQGEQRLAQIADAFCIQCHTDLESAVPGHSSDIDTTISSFAGDGGHPDWDVLADPQGDPGTLLFNHARHIHPSEHQAASRLTDNEGNEATLHCDDCHRAGVSPRPWRFATSQRDAHQDRRQAMEYEPEQSGAYMGDIRYALHCAGCHAKEFRPVTVDRRQNYRRIQLNGTDATSNGLVPHDTPEAIRTYLRGELIEFLTDDDRLTQAAALAETLDRQIAWKPTDPPHIDAEDADPTAMKVAVSVYIATEINEIENALYRQEPEAPGQPGQGCRKCHTVTFNPDAALPTIAPPQIKRRWLSRAVFSHEKHQTATTIAAADVAAAGGQGFPTLADAICIDCHKVAREPDRGADQSTATSDVLLAPGIAGCRRCHESSSASAASDLAGGAPHNCVLCHTYHKAPASKSQPGDTHAG